MKICGTIHGNSCLYIFSRKIHRLFISQSGLCCPRISTDFHELTHCFARVVGYAAECRRPRGQRRRSNSPISVFIRDHLWENTSER